MSRGYDSICCFRSRDESSGRRVCWEITTDCNLNCPFCHRYDFNSEYYDIKRLSQTISLLHEHGIKNIILSGGEPLLHPSFFELVDKLYIAGFDLDVCSNGVPLDDEIIRKLKVRLGEISISIDGYEAEQHDRMRHTPGCFESTIKNLDLLVLAGIEVHVTTVVDVSFAGNIDSMTRFLHVHGVRSVSYLGLIPLGIGYNPLFSPECQKILEKQIDIVREKYSDMSINTKQLLINRSRCKCEAGNLVFGLGTDGLVLYPCLLTRKREGVEAIGSTEGLCPGSRYLTQRKESIKC